MRATDSVGLRANKGKILSYVLKQGKKKHKSLKRV